MNVIDPVTFVRVDSVLHVFLRKDYVFDTAAT